MESPRLEYTAELLRHFADLRDGTHGGAISRRDKEHLFTAAVPLLDPHARQALGEINTDLLLGTGEVKPLPVIGALIAATARVHGMTVVTRNVKDFELAGVRVVNPFAE